MTYPSQPGYPTPQYGGQSPQPQQQNNLWLIGGAVLAVLIIIMTVILVVVQQTQGSSGNEGSDGGDGSNEGGSDNGGDDGGGGPVELASEACDSYDLAGFEEAYGPIEPSLSTRTETSSSGLGSLSCAFYNEVATGVNVRITDYETAEDVQSSIDSDADYYGTEPDYEFSEYTDYGDAGAFYKSTSSGTTSLYLHIAVGSLDVYVTSTLWSGENVDEAAATTAMEDLAAQSGELFADYT